jgi:hypothetical protein
LHLPGLSTRRLRCPLWSGDENTALRYVPFSWRVVRVVFIPKPGHSSYIQVKPFNPVALPPSWWIRVDMKRWKVGNIPIAFPSACIPDWLFIVLFTRMRGNCSLSSLQFVAGAEAMALAYMLRGVDLLCHRGWDIGHAQILMLLAESDPFSDESG